MSIAASSHTASRLRELCTAAATSIARPRTCARAASSTWTSSRRRASSTSTSTSTSASQAIRYAFDTSSSSLSTGTPVGRFGYAALKRPEDFASLTRRTQLRANAIVNRMLAYSPSVSPSGIERHLLVQVKQIDRLSDLLCGVIDLAELVRNVDPDPEWIAHADASYQELCYYMNQLNTHVGLYEALKRVYDPVAQRPPSIASGFSSSTLFPALSVASQFLSDFEKSGIHLPQAQRDRFVTLSDDILTLGREFTSPSAPVAGESHGDAARMVPITVDELRAWGSTGAALVASKTVRSGEAAVGRQLYLHADSGEAHALRREHPDQSVRKRFHLASYAGPETYARVESLEALLVKRAQLAHLVGKRTWAHVALGDKMARTPENVRTFLASLAERNRPLAQRDLQQLIDAKHRHTGGSGSNSRVRDVTIEPWDRDYYYALAVTQSNPATPHPATLAPYFSVGTCISGLSLLFSRIYGIHFEIEATRPGETWLPDGEVKKLAVIDEREGKIGEIYCDLFAREGKPPGAAHFTVRCSRRLDDDAPERDFEHMGENDRRELLHDLNDSGGDPLQFPLAQEAHALKGREGTHQLPLVVLSCEFDKPSEGRPGLLNWQEVETLFHEMGHAMHSMIGRTEYHNVAGTRCATDLVELPSILMEHFASSDAVLNLFARHHKTDAPLPLHLLRHLQHALKGFAALESNSQIMMAVLDQRYHGLANADAEGLDSTAVYMATQREVGATQPAPGTPWQANFGHLFGYGATYYSYLFDRAIAQRVFSRLFEADPLSRESGEKYKEELLRHGGGKDPWSCVAGVLGEEALARGDRAAMDAVGSWNVDP